VSTLTDVKESLDLIGDTIGDSQIYSENLVSKLEEIRQVLLLIVKYLDYIHNSMEGRD